MKKTILLLGTILCFVLFNAGSCVKDPDTDPTIYDGCINNHTSRFNPSADSIGVVVKYVYDLSTSSTSGLSTGDYVYVLDNSYTRSLPSTSPYRWKYGNICKIKWLTDGRIQAAPVIEYCCMYFYDVIGTVGGSGLYDSYLFWNCDSNTGSGSWTRHTIIR